MNFQSVICIMCTISGVFRAFYPIFALSGSLRIPLFRADFPSGIPFFVHIVQSAK